jgi:hypothetical protein
MAMVVLLLRLALRSGLGRVLITTMNHLDRAPGDQVDEQAAADGGRNADEDRRNVGQIVEQGLFRADDREQAH